MDQSVAKIGKYSPGARIPIVDFGAIELIKPDFILILPWNLKDEILPSLEFTRNWGCKMVTAIPSIKIF